MRGSAESNPQSIPRYQKDGSIPTAVTTDSSQGKERDVKSDQSKRKECMFSSDMPPCIWILVEHTDCQCVLIISRTTSRWSCSSFTTNSLEARAPAIKRQNQQRRVWASLGEFRWVSQVRVPTYIYVMLSTHKITVSAVETKQGYEQ